MATETIASEAASIRETLANKMTDEEFCREFKVSRVTSWRYRKSGVLPYVRVGAAIYYLPRHLEIFLERRSPQVRAAGRRTRKAA